MRMQLQRHNFEVVYKPAKSLVLADTLSRACLTESVGGRNRNFETELSAMVSSNSHMSTEKLMKVKQETKRDETLQELANVVLKCWPNAKKKVSVCLRRYWNLRDMRSQCMME